MDRRAFLAAVATGLTGAITGCGGSGGGDYDVGMSSRRYEPASIEVSPGTTVVWKNTNADPHTVTAREDEIPEDAAFFASGGYDSQDGAESAWQAETGGVLSEGETYEHEFAFPGEYPYYCIPHEAAGMVGVVTVTEDADGTE